MGSGGGRRGRRDLGFLGVVLLYEPYVSQLRILKRGKRRRMRKGMIMGEKRGRRKKRTYPSTTQPPQKRHKTPVASSVRRTYVRPLRVRNRR